MISKQQMKDIRRYLENLLESNPSDLGIKFTVGNARYTSNTCNFKIEGATIGEDGRVFSEEANNFKLYAADYGLDPEDLGRKFTDRGQVFTITGINPRRPKFPISVESDGKSYKYTAGGVKAGLLENLLKGE